MPVRGWRRAASRITAALLLCAVAGMFAGALLSHLRTVVEGGDSSAAVRDLQLWSVALVVATLAALLLEVANASRRFRTPERQVRRAMQRIRAGDVGFRVALRRGEPLGALVHECNDLLEWLNRNPPPGSRLDADVFELEEGEA